MRFVSAAVAWTEVPENLRTLARQRQLTAGWRVQGLRRVIRRTGGWGEMSRQDHVEEPAALSTRAVV